MDINDFKRIQEQQLLIMDDIHRVCTQKGYRYYLIGGSALGAVRHGGMIPWDVDIDIAMPRKDYELFVSTANETLSQRFELHDYRTDKSFGTVHALVVLKDSVLLFKNDLKKNRRNRFGIFVDVLPLDQWPNNCEQKKMQIRQIKRMRNIREFYQGAETANDSMMKSLFKKVVQLGLHLWYSQYNLNQIQQRIVSQFDTLDEGKEWCSMLSHYSLEKLTFPKEIFGAPKLMSFSKREYFVPEQVELYLKQLFGDYMKEPSKEKQIEQIESVHQASWKDIDGNSINILNETTCPKYQ